jgi:hypothetical protein
VPAWEDNAQPPHLFRWDHLDEHPAKSFAGRQLQLRFGACHLRSVPTTLDDLRPGQQEYVDQG